MKYVLQVDCADHHTASMCLQVMALAGIKIPNTAYDAASCKRRRHGKCVTFAFLNFLFVLISQISFPHALFPFFTHLKHKSNN